ncbi:MAG: hypothetical protein ACRDON_02925 [Gaiellaceae bacterium]
MIDEFVEQVNEMSPRTAALLYGGVMTVWIVGFAGTDWNLPAPVVLVLLLLPGLLHFGLGYVVRDWWALYLTGVPVVVAAAAGGLPSPLWVAVVLLTACPGAPLIVAGVYVRDWLERRDPSYVDPWLI